MAARPFLRGLRLHHDEESGRGRQSAREREEETTADRSPIQPLSSGGPSMMRVHPPSVRGERHRTQLRVVAAGKLLSSCQELRAHAIEMRCTVDMHAKSAAVAVPRGPLLEQLRRSLALGWLTLKGLDRASHHDPPDPTDFRVPPGPTQTPPYLLKRSRCPKVAANSESGGRSAHSSTKNGHREARGQRRSPPAARLGDGRI
jgi:hypothetical protein